MGGFFIRLIESIWSDVVGVLGLLLDHRKKILSSFAVMIGWLALTQ